MPFTNRDSNKLFFLFFGGPLKVLQGPKETKAVIDPGLVPFWTAPAFEPATIDSSLWSKEIADNTSERCTRNDSSSSHIPAKLGLGSKGIAAEIVAA